VLREVKPKVQTNAQPNVQPNVQPYALRRERPADLELGLSQVPPTAGANDNYQSFENMLAELESVYPPGAREESQPFIPGATVPTVRSLLQEALDGGADFNSIMAGVWSYRQYIEAWGGDRLPKPLRRFLSCKAWEGRNWGDLPPAGYVPACAKPWPEDWRARFWSAFPDRSTVKFMTPAKMEAERRMAEQELEKLAGTAKVSFESIEAAAKKCRCDLGDPKFAKNPVKWLSEEPWKSGATSETLEERHRRSCQT
jgi:hypothetical protein